MTDRNELETQLILRAATGEHYAYEQLIRRYQKLVRSVLTNLCRDPFVADDLAQMTFLKAWEKLSGFRGGMFKSWLCKIAVREFLMHKRKYAREANASSDVERLGEEDIAKHDSTEANYDLQKVLNSLPEDAAQLLVLHLQVGFSHVEIAEMLSLPLGTVKSKIRRTLKQIQSSWSQINE